MRSSLLQGALCALLGAVACNTTPPHQNPFDPGSPGTVQAKSTLAGSIALESTGPGIFLSGIHVAVVGTGLAADTNAAGAYSISGVAPGTYTLLVSKAGYESVTIPAVTVTLADGEKTVSVSPALLKVARGTITGTITLEGETSSAGVTVSLSGYQGAVETGADGSYVFSNVPEGIYNLTGSKVAFNPATAPGLQVASGATTRAPDLTLSANPGSIAGTVTLQGAAISGGVSVTADGTTLGGNHHVANGVTDAAGNFTLSPIPAGSYNVSFQLTDYLSQSTAATVSPGAATVIAALTLLRQTGATQGTALLQGATDNSGIVVSLVPAASPVGATPTATTLTDLGGAWRLDAIPVGTYAISYQKTPGYGSASGSVTIVQQATATAAPVQLVAIPGLIQGTVTLENGGDPSGVVTVAIEGSSTQAAPLKDGTYQLFPVGAGTQTVKFSAAGFDTLRTQVTLTPAEQLQLAAVTLVKSRGGVVGMLAVEGRTDASGVLIVVHATALTAVTGPSGTFQISNIPIGTYTLDLTLAGYGPLSIPAVVISAGLSTQAPAATLSILRTSQVGGAVSLEGSSNAAGATVHLAGTDLNGAAVTAPDQLLTGSTNNYSFTGLPAGSFTISASAGGYVTGTIPAATVGAGASLGEAALQLSIARGLVQGAVTLPSGAPSSSGTLVQITQVPPGAASFTALTSASGAFSIAGVPAGSYTLSATHAGYAAYSSGSGTSLVSLGATTTIPAVALTFDSSASIAGTCQAIGAPSQAGSAVALSGTDFNGNPVTGVAPTTTATDQSFIIAGLRAGSFIVSCTRLGFTGASAAPIALSAGEAATSVALSLAVATVPLNGQVSLSAGGLAGFIPEADLSGFAVTLSATVANDLPKPLTAATAADGSFTFPAVPYSLSGAAYTLRTSRSGYLAASQSVSVIPPATPGPVALTLAVAQSTLAGLVTVPAPAADSSGVAVALTGTAFNGSAVSASGTSSASATANYGFSLAAGNYSLSFTRAGFAPSTASLTVPIPPSSGSAPALTGPPVTLARASGSVTGKVVVNDGGTSLAVDNGGVQVALTESSGTDLTGGPYIAVTDSGGNFTIANVPVSLSGASYSVSVSKTGFTATGSATVTVAAAPAVSAPAGSLSLSLIAGSVSGVVSVPAPAANSGGVTAALSGTAYNGAPWSNPSPIVSAASGSYTFAAVPPGSYTLQLSLTGYDAVSVTGITVSAAVPKIPAPQTLHRSTGALYGTITVGANGTGLSLGANDAAIASITVSDPSLAQTYTATTDSSGSWFIGGIPVTLSGAYTVTASKPGYLSATTTGSVVAGTSSATTSTPALNAAPSSAAGLIAVPAPAASPAGVTVSLSGAAFNGSVFGPMSVSSTAATTGSNYSFASLPAGSFTLAFSRAGYVVASAALTVPIPPATGAAPAIASASPTLVRATGTVAGKVTVTDGGTGLAINAGGVLIAITQPAGTDLGAGPYSAVTDSGGNFAIANVPVSLSGASYTVSASEAVFTAAGTTTVTVAPSPATSAPVTTLSLSVSAGTVAGVVSVPAPAANSGGVSATLSGIAFNGAAWSSPVATSQDGTAGTTNGAFTFASVPPGVFTLQLTRASYDPLSVATVTVSAGATTTVSTVATPLVLKRSTGGLYGSVTLAANGTGLSLSGADAAGINLAVSGAGLSSAFSAASDATGNWILPALPVPVAPATSYTLTISKPGYLAVSGAVTPIAGLNTQVVAAALTSLSVAPSTLAGTVTAAPATSAAGVSVVVAGTAFNGTAFGPTSSVLTGAGAQLGQYSIANLPAGNFQVSFARAGYLSQSASVTVPIYASGSTPTIAGPSPALVRATGTVSGTVAAQDSAPATGLSADPGGAIVSLTQPAGADLNGGSYQATCDTSGNFTIAAVPVSPSGATYTVSVIKPNYSVIAGPTTVLVGADVVTAPSGALTLAVNASNAGGTVTVPSPAANSAGVTAHLTGTAFNGAAWSNPNVITSVANGSYTFPAVPAGNYTLQLTFAGYDTFTLPGIKVPPGATTAIAPVTLLRSTGQLYGTVALSANGTGLSLAAADLVGVSVTISDASLSATYSASTDSAGNWSIAGVPVTLPLHPPYVVTAIKSGYWNASTTGTVVAGVASPAAAGMTLNVAPTNASGFVLLVNPQPPTGNASVTASIAGIAFNGVSFSASAAPVAAPNTWSLANVPAGNYTLTLTGSSTYVPVSQALVVPVPPGSPASAATLSANPLTLPRGSAGYSGTVQPGPNGTGLTLGSGACTSTPAADCANVTVSVTDASLAATFGAITDSNGRYTIANVPLPADPAHGYTIGASKSGFINSAPGGGTVLAAAGTTLAAIALPANSDRVTGCVYVPSTTGGAPDSVTGVTATLSGTAFNGTAFQKGGSLAADLTNACSLSGAAVYTFTGVPDGSYTVALTRTSYFAAVAPTVTVTGANAVASPLVTKMARATGAISGTVTVRPNGTGLVIGPGELSGALVTISGPDLPSALATVTDSTGNFVLGNIPVNVTAGYTVLASKSQFTAGPGGGVPVTLSANTTTAVPGLTLDVTPATLTVTAEIHDFLNSGDPANVTTSGINVSVTGTAFNGAPVSPSAQPTNGSAQAIFASLPSGTYAVSATYPSHTTGTAAGVTLQNGTPASVKVQLTDTISPTAPSVAFSNQSPTSATSTTLTLTVASTDATLPVQNLRGYQYRQCVSSVCGPFFRWDGSALFVSMPAGSQVRYDVFAEDWNDNQSQIVSTTSILSVPNPPATPLNVHVDNRPGSVRISWDAAVPSLSAAPVAGYKVYYGPIDGFAPTDYNGDNAAQGVSPITLTGTELTLTSLPNASAFYVAVSAFDGVVDPKPNESTISSGVKANPNNAPLDRAAHLTTTTTPTAPANALGMAVQRDRLFVSSGTAPGNYAIDTYQYDRYGTLTKSPNAAYLGSSTRANVLVADSNRTIYAFDPTATVAGCAAASSCGVDVIDVSSGTPALWSTDLGGVVIDHLLPLHRGSANTSQLHGVVTYRDAGGHRMATYNDFTDHEDIGFFDPDSLALHTNTTVLDVVAANQYVFTLQQSGPNVTVDGYTVPDTFSTAISYSNSVTAPYGVNNTAALAVDWPNIYFTAGQTLYRASIFAGPPLSFGGAVVQATLRTPARSLSVVGDLLIAGEDAGYGVTAVEAFQINPGGSTLTLAGSYELNDPQELPSQTTLHSLQVSGTNLFALMANAYGQTSLDVIEMGSPRYLTRLGTANSGNMFASSVAAKGSRALAVMGDGFSNYQLHDIDMHSLFAGNLGYTHSNTYASAPNCSDPNSFTACNPIAVWGDYAFVAQEPGANGPTVIAIYDVSTPAALTAAATPIATVTASAFVTGLSAGSGYLIASVESATHAVEWWDISAITAPGPALTLAASSQAYGHSVDFYGRYAYVGTMTGFCIVDVFSARGGTPAEIGCTTFTDPSVTGPIGARSIYADADKVYASTARGSSGSGGPALQLRQYDISVPSAPAAFGPFFGTQTGGVPAGLLRTGPYLLASYNNSSQFDGLGGFALTASATITPSLVGTVSNFANLADAPAALAGPFLLAPDYTQGLVMIRMY